MFNQPLSERYEEDRFTDLSDHDMFMTLSVNNLDPNALIPALYLENRRLNLLNERADKYKIALTNLSFSQNDVYMFDWDLYHFTVTLSLYDDTFGVNNPLTSTQILDFVPFHDAQRKLVRTNYQITESINAGYLAAFNSIISQYNTLFSPDTYASNPAYPQIPPILIYDSSLKLYFFRCDPKMNADAFNPEACINPSLSSTANHVVMQLACNKDVFTLLKGMPAFALGTTTPDPIDGKYAIIKVYDITAINTYDPMFTPFYDISQPGASTNMGYDFHSIVVTCDHMLVRGTLLNAATNKAINLQTSGPQSSTISRNLLHPPIPYTPSLSGQADQFGQYSWEQTGEYRWMDITSTSTFNTLNYQLYLTGQDSSLQPVFLTPFTNASITILIRKK